MRGFGRRVVNTLGIGLLCLAPVASVLAQTTESALMARGATARSQGDIDQAIEAFSAAMTQAPGAEQHASAAGELGATLVLAHRLDQAEPLLQQAYAGAPLQQRARYAVDLGNLFVARHQPDLARPWYQQASAASDPAVRVSAGLDLARLEPSDRRLLLLRRIAVELDQVESSREQGQFRLNLGYQAEQLGPAGLELAYDNVARAEHDAEAARLFGLAAESGDTLAQIYEDQHRDREALQLNRRAIELAHAALPSEVAETTVSLDWREARLDQSIGQSDAAIAAYQRAVEQIQRIRQDLPIDYDDGRSSFVTTLKPIYLGLADLELARVHQLPAQQRSDQLRRITDTLELLKQAEMQDYLGDRCTVDAIEEGKPQPGPGVAFIYPIVLKDRVELILETATGLSEAAVPVGQDEVDTTVRRLALSLRADAPGFEGPAAQVYDWLLRPLAAQLQQQSITTIVLVSDGVLRLVPLSVLYDGQHYVVEQYATATVTGLSMTNARPATGTAPSALIAGMSVAGPVVDALDAALQHATRDQSLTVPAHAEQQTRGLSVAIGPTGAETTERAATRASLALPGVRDEVNSLEATLHGTLLLDDQFTEKHFEDDAASGDYRIVHIASHGFFGGSASDSFILTYDKLLTIDQLQSLLESGPFRAHPIEILSLSACETAEGNERSPLGISGAAMKARAKSVVGTLWPVEDHAAQIAMERFYQGIKAGHLSKAEALRQAQLELLQQPTSARPFYWAPFVLIGNWL